MDYLKRLLNELEEEDDELEEMKNVQIVREEKNEEFDVMRNARVRKDEKRNALSVGTISMRRDPLTYFSDVEFKMHFRLDKENAVTIIKALSSDLDYSSNRNRPIPPGNQFLLTLRFYAAGSSFLKMAKFMGVSPSSAHRLVQKVTTCLMQYKSQFITLPENTADLKNVRMGNYNIAKFPRVLGLIDATHIKIYCPGGDRPEEFRNRRGIFSLNVQCVVKHDLTIMDVVARWPGSAHASTIFNSSRVKARIDAGEFGNSVLLGDSAYNMSPSVMTPISNPTTPEEILYNEAHMLTRNVVNQAFGLWKRRFPVLGLVTQVKYYNVQRIIVATIVLHNMLIQLRDDEPAEDTGVRVYWDNDDDNDDCNDSNGNLSADEDRRLALAARQEFVSHFRSVLDPS